MPPSFATASTSPPTLPLGNLTTVGPSDTSTASLSNSATRLPSLGAAIFMPVTQTTMVVQLALTALGMSAALGALATWFEYLRWLGVAYLLWLGIRQWRAPPIDLTHIPPQPRSARAIALRGFLVSLTNPKTLLFYGAFLPQFIDPGRPLAPQIALLSAVFLALALLLDSGWAVLAGRARFLLASRGRLRNRLSGGMLMCAGLGLALARRR